MSDQNLEQLTNAGVCVYDLNAEYLHRKDWAKTSLGPRSKWSEALDNYVNLIQALPHPAAVFWGPQLAIVHNIAWGSSLAFHDGQGAPSAEWTQGEARGSLNSALTGRTIRVAGTFFFKHTPRHAPEAPVLICPLLDENGRRQGAFAQLLHDAPSQYTLDTDLLGKESSSKKSNSNESSSNESSSNESSSKESSSKESSSTPSDEPSHMSQNKSQNNEILGKSEQDQEDALDKISRPPGNLGGAVNKEVMHQHMDSKQSQLFQRFAELLPTGLAILDHKAEAVFVNDQFFHLTTQKSSHEFRSWPESIDPRDYERVMGQYREAFGRRQEVKVEFRCVIDDDVDRSDEEDFENPNWRMFLLKPLGTSKKAGYICAVVDISELKNAEQSQERAAQDAKDRKQQQERFIDMVSHEIRNPLSAVLHLAEEIKQTVKTTEWSGDKTETATEIIDAADTILLCVSHQSVLVDDILAFSKLDSMMLSLAPSVAQPKWAFSRQLKVFQAELKSKHIDFEYALDISVEENGIDWVVADLGRIKQVLVNLMTNAIKFTAKKDGERRIKVAMGASFEKPTSYPPNVVFFENKDNAFHLDQTLSQDWGEGPIIYLMLVVKDTGIGINSDNQVKLFERFRQATPKTSETYGGSGLGLSISRKLCQLHGGDIGVASKEGQGSTFGFYFKVRRASPPADDDSTASGRSTPRRALSSETSLPTRPRLRSGQNSHRKSTDKLSTDKLPEAGNDGDGKPSQERRSTILKIGGQQGVDRDSNSTLNKPPVRFEPDAHPGTNLNERTSETEKNADKAGVEPQPAASKINDETGETPQQAKSSKQTHDAQNKAPSETKGTLLLVEDNMINQKVLKRQLQNHGFQVFTANNGQEAVDAVIKRAEDAHSSDNNAESQHESGDDRFICILMDQEMPIKDGNTAAREIKELQDSGEVGRSPILGVSANVRQEQMKTMRDAGMDDVISKPFKVQDLVKKIRSLAERVLG